MVAPTVEGGDQGVLEELFRRGGLQVLQTPLVEIESGAPVAVRLVTHGLAGTDVIPPARLQTLVAASPHAVSLDEGARARALAEVQIAPLLPGTPAVLDAHLGSFTQLLPNNAGTDVVLLVDSSDVLARAAEMLRLVATARGEGWEVGLREVGSTVDSLTAVSLLEPALVVLSPRVVEEPTSRLSVETVQATTAFCHSSGALLAVDGVTDPATVAAAVAVGATLVSGPLYSATGLPPTLPAEPLLQRFTAPPPVSHQSPFELASRRHPARRATKPMLVELSKRLEAVAEPAGRSSVVLAAFQTAEQFTPATEVRYRRLAERCTLVMAAAQGLEHTTTPNLSVAALDPSDPLVHEWNVIVLAPTMAAMLTASDARVPARRDEERAFDYLLTYDRDLVAHAARSMLSRLTHRAC